MGSSISIQPLDCQEIRLHQWEQVQDKQKLFGKNRTLRNHRTGAMLDQYQLSWQSKHEYSFYIKSFNWRNRRRNHSPIVLSVALNLLGMGDICTQKYTANIYLEHIPLRLSQIQDIPICESLFILVEALDGYSQLYQHSGYFKVQEQQICIDRSGKVKVWVNGDLSKNYPECDTDCSHSKKDEIDMVEQLLDIISKSTNAQQMPSPSLLYIFHQKGNISIWQEGDRWYLLASNMLKLSSFNLLVYQIRIPNRFETIMQLFTPNLTINKNHSTNIESLPSSIQFIHRQPPRLQHTFSMPQFSPNMVYQPRRNQLNYSQPLTQKVNHSSENTFPYIIETNQSQYIRQIPQSLNLEDLNINRQQGQQTKRKSGNSNNSKRSKNSKSQMIVLQNNTQNHSISFHDGNTEDRNTMKSMPNYNIKLSNNRFGNHLQKVRHSQYLMGSVEQERNFGRKTQFNKDSFGMAIPHRRIMKESYSSNNFTSNNSSQSQKEQVSNQQSKNSGQSAQNRMIEEFKQIVLQVEKKEAIGKQEVSKQWQLDPEIEADMRRYLGQ